MCGFKCIRVIKIKKMKSTKYIIVFLFLFSAFRVNAQKIKVIAYNVEFAKSTTPEAMAAFLKKEKADIICFNEVPAQGWTKTVGELLGLPYSYEGKIASAHHTEGFKDKTQRYYGKYKSILSRYPLENTHEITIKGSGWSPAGAVVATVKVNKNKSVQVFSLHIPSGKSNPDNSKAFHLSELIKKEYSTTEKMIVCGDFNDVSNSKPLQYLYGSELQNSWISLNTNLSELTTYPGSKRGYVIDHILFKGIKAKKAGVLKENEPPLSDHSAVWLVFKL